MSAGGSDDFKRTMEALEPISKVCLAKLSETRCASTINTNDLRDVRKTFNMNLQVKDADKDAL